MNRIVLNVTQYKFIGVKLCSSGKRLQDLGKCPEVLAEQAVTSMARGTGFDPWGKSCDA